MRVRVDHHVRPNGEILTVVFVCGHALARGDEHTANEIAKAAGLKSYSVMTFGNGIPEHQEVQVW